MIDQAKNFARGILSTGYDSSATSIVLTAGHGARFPTPPFNATWWNATDYPDPSDDPNVEIVTVTAISTNTLTVVRGQENIAASTKNTAGKAYKLMAGLTAKTVNEDLMPSMLSEPGFGTFYDYDDMYSANYGEQAGKLRWSRIGSGGSASTSYFNGEANHPGVHRITTDAATNGYMFSQLRMYSNAIDPFARWDNIGYWQHHFIFRLNTITNVLAYVGLNTNSWGSDTGIGLILDTAVNANWRFVLTRWEPGVSYNYDTNTFAPNTTDWLHLRIRAVDIGKWGIALSINGGSFLERTFGPSGCDNTYGLQSTKMAPLFSLTTRENAQKTMDMDFYGGRIDRLNR